MKTIANLSGSPLVKANGGGVNQSLLVTENPTNANNNREIKYIAPDNICLGTNNTCIKISDTNSKIDLSANTCSLPSNINITEPNLDIDGELNVSAGDVNLSGYCINISTDDDNTSLIGLQTTNANIKINVKYT